MRPSTIAWLFAASFASSGLLLAQEREVPKDSTRISIPGCANGRSFIVMTHPEHEDAGVDVEPGRRFRLSGRRPLLDEIKKNERTLVEVTGLVRTSQLAEPGGIRIAPGVRIGGGPQRDPISADPRRDPNFNTTVIDVESWRPLPGSCPER